MIQAFFLHTFPFLNKALTLSGSICNTWEQDFSAAEYAFI